MMLRALIRTDAGGQIGFGHLRRCLSLAGALRARDVCCSFLIDGSTQALEEIEEAGFDGDLAAGDVHMEATVSTLAHHLFDCLIVDSYRVLSEPLGELARIMPVVTVDDLPRDLPAHLSIDSTVDATTPRHSAAARYLLGADYAILRPEFAAAPPERDPSRGVERVLISVGGSDPHNLTPGLLRWTQQVLCRAEIHVVVGPLFTGEQEPAYDRDECSAPVVHRSPRCMRQLMVESDLAICGGGQTTYELAATGTPAIAIQIADNQARNLRAFADQGSLLFAGGASDADLEDRVADAVHRVASDNTLRRRMSERGRELVDGRGAARVAEEIAALISGGGQ